MNLALAHALVLLGAGEPAEQRRPEVHEGSRANGATGGRRERGTGCPGEGGNAAVDKRKKSFRQPQLNPIDLIKISSSPAKGLGHAKRCTHLLNIVTMIKGGLWGTVDVQ